MTTKNTTNILISLLQELIDGTTKFNQEAQQYLEQLNQQNVIPEHLKDANDQVFLVACKNGVVMDVALMLKFRDQLNINIEYAQGEENTPLCFSCWNGHIAITDMLLEAGADPTFKELRCLRLASSNGHIGTVRLLLQSPKITKLDDVSKWSETPLTSAIKNSHWDIVRILLNDSRSQPRECDLEFLKEKNIDLFDEYNYKTFNKVTQAYFLDACEYNKVDDVRMILKHFKEWNLRINALPLSSSENDPLCCACKKGNYEIAEMLLKAGADPTFMESICFRLAVQSGMVNLVERLMADPRVDISNIVSCADRKNRSALTCAIDLKYWTMVERLLNEPRYKPYEKDLLELKEENKSLYDKYQIKRLDDVDTDISHIIKMISPMEAEIFKKIVNHPRVSEWLKKN